MKTITLNSPITYTGADKAPVTITEVALRKMKVKDMKATDEARRAGGDLAASIALLASITGIPAVAIEEMDADDFTAVNEALRNFLPPPPVSVGVGEQ